MLLADITVSVEVGMLIGVDHVQTGVKLLATLNFDTPTG